MGVVIERLSGQLERGDGAEPEHQGDSKRLFCAVDALDDDDDV